MQPLDVVSRLPFAPPLPCWDRVGHAAAALPWVPRRLRGADELCGGPGAVLSLCPAAESAAGAPSLATASSPPGAWEAAASAAAAAAEAASPAGGAAASGNAIVPAPVASGPPPPPHCDIVLLGGAPTLSSRDPAPAAASQSAAGGAAVVRLKATPGAPGALSPVENACWEERLPEMARAHHTVTAVGPGELLVIGGFSAPPRQPGRGSAAGGAPAAEGARRRRSSSRRRALPRGVWPHRAATPQRKSAAAAAHAAGHQPEHGPGQRFAPGCVLHVQSGPRSAPPGAPGSMQPVAAVPLPAAPFAVCHSAVLCSGHIVLYGGWRPASRSKGDPSGASPQLSAAVSVLSRAPGGGWVLSHTAPEPSPDPAATEEAPARTQKPAPRAWHTAVAHAGVMWVLGGAELRAPAVPPRQQPPPAPSVKVIRGGASDSSAECDGADGWCPAQAMPCGRQLAVPSAELWAYDVAKRTWHRPSAAGDCPSARVGHAACLINCSTGVAMVIAGGAGAAAGEGGGAYTFCLTEFLWRHLRLPLGAASPGGGPPAELQCVGHTLHNLSGMTAAPQAVAPAAADSQSAAGGGSAYVAMLRRAGITPYPGGAPDKAPPAAALLLLGGARPACGWLPSAEQLGLLTPPQPAPGGASDSGRGKLLAAACSVLLLAPLAGRTQQRARVRRLHTLQLAAREAAGKAAPDAARGKRSTLSGLLRRCWEEAASGSGGQRAPCDAIRAAAAKPRRASAPAAVAALRGLVERLPQGALALTWRQVKEKAEAACVANLHGEELARRLMRGVELRHKYLAEDDTPARRRPQRGEALRAANRRFYYGQVARRRGVLAEARRRLEPPPPPPGPLPLKGEAELKLFVSHFYQGPVAAEKRYRQLLADAHSARLRGEEPKVLHLTDLAEMLRDPAQDQPRRTTASSSQQKVLQWSSRAAQRRACAQLAAGARPKRPPPSARETALRAAAKWCIARIGRVRGFLRDLLMDCTQQQSGEGSESAVSEQRMALRGLLQTRGMLDPEDGAQLTTLLVAASNAAAAEGGSIDEDLGAAEDYFWTGTGFDRGHPNLLDVQLVRTRALDAAARHASEAARAAAASRFRERLVREFVGEEQVSEVNSVDKLDLDGSERPSFTLGSSGQRHSTGRVAARLARARTRRLQRAGAAYVRHCWEEVTDPDATALPSAAINPLDSPLQVPLTSPLRVPPPALL
eukprot:TRINITY_DN21546_c0_g1_i1.p1 TRINITY_DN21546_c0_g1~~TRINITY_DN21546_c0_g1_i1.p1  ORF type:complete len:1225 (+),score=205.48 TRINITY_DN21546_c0_g1_i1:71-3676(+)